MISVPREDLILMLEAGYLYLAMKRPKEARALFEGVCELAPKHDVPLVAVSNVYFFEGKYLEAIRVLKQSLKDNPQSAYAYSHLGEALLFYGKKEDAIKNLNKACELEPKPEDPSGKFARALLDLIKMGYSPQEQRKIYKKFLADQKKNKEQTQQK